MPDSVDHAFSIPFAHPADELWSIISDTQRLNELVGNPKYEAYEVLRDDGVVDVFGRVSLAGIAIEWLEVPVNWIENGWFEQVRRFSNGPLHELTARIEIAPTDEGCQCNVKLVSQVKNLLGRFVAKQAAAKFEKGTRKVLAAAHENLLARQPVRFNQAVKISASARARAGQLVERIEATPYGQGLAHRLADYILSAQEVDLWTLRPLALARLWDEDERAVVEMCLQAVKAGLLESRWDLLCPRCRVSKEASLEMADLPKGVHCPSCNIDYQLDFSNNVELAFSPGPAVRPVEYGFFCRSGPSVTPHIKGQITLESGEHKSIPTHLTPGDYRVRTLEAGGELDVTWDGGPFPAIELSGDEVLGGPGTSGGKLEISNVGSARRTLIIEDRSWRRDVLTAERVTTLQAFRDLFSGQVLRAGDEVSISTITFMFTDLAGSTAMFAQVGDAKAYQVVREHFALLGGVIREHNGTIVKTIGDGIHAAFNAPDDAFNAAVSIQAAVAKWRCAFTELDVGVRVGLHTGSSISVNLNDRLDYYGSTVNMAARLEGQGEAGEITMSAALVSDVAVKSLLQRFDVRCRDATLKGFDQAVKIYQIKP